MDVLKAATDDERKKIEQWTNENTFPHVIKFIQDADGNYIVGKEVLTDPAFEKIITTDDQTKTQESITSYLSKETTTITYKAKTDETKEAITGTK